MKTVMLPANANIEFLSKSTTQKGAIAEELVRQYLIANNCIPYAPPSTAGAHPIDFMVVDKISGQTIFFADVKCKAQRTNYPDTGINARHYEKYKWMGRRENKDVYLFFADESTGEIYGNFLSVLDQDRAIEHNHRVLQYPIRDIGRSGPIIYFPRVAMDLIAHLDPEDIAKLKGLCSSEFASKNSQQSVIDLAVQS
jgi:hypothetical protein